MKIDNSFEELMTSGHLACQACGGAMIMRHCLKALGEDTICVIPASCWSIMCLLLQDCNGTVKCMNGLRV